VLSTTLSKDMKFTLKPTRIHARVMRNAWCLSRRRRPPGGSTAQTPDPRDPTANPARIAARPTKRLLWPCQRRWWKLAPRLSRPLSDLARWLLRRWRHASCEEPGKRCAAVSAVRSSPAKNRSLRKMWGPSGEAQKKQLPQNADSSPIDHPGWGG